MRSLVFKLASLKLTFFGMGWLMINAVAISRWSDATSWLVLPLSLLSLNLLAAILVNRTFRSQAALLLFHVGLLGVLVLAGAGLLLRFEGHVEVVEGAEFDPREVNVRSRGWLHAGGLEKVNFTQGPIEVRYRSGLLRDTTRTTVKLSDGRSVYVGDRQSVSPQGYRLMTTFNKGYSLLLSWEGDDGSRSLGAINFPSYPDLEWKQINAWTTPVGETVQLELSLPERAPDGDSWVLASGTTRYDVTVLRDGNTAMSVREGGAFRVKGGRVQIRDLRLWMGYRIDYNPVLSWLVAAAFLSLAALAVYVQQKFRAPQAGLERAAVGRRQAA